MKSDPALQLIVPPRMWAGFRQAMLASRFNQGEVIGFLFCTRHRVSPRKWRLLPKAWVVPTAECYEHQSMGGLALRQSFHWYLYKTYIERGLDVVHVHTHPHCNVPRFSAIDDYHEAEYARFLSRLPGRLRLVSGVFDERMTQGRFRAWPIKPDWQPGPAALSTKILEILDADCADGGREFACAARFDRQRVFGLGVQESLGAIAVGLVGCGGIGAVFAEQLARLGVRRWVLVDPDVLEETNLNRLPCATPQMAARRWPKVRYVKRLIKTAWPAGSQVTSLCLPIEDRQAQRRLAACDLIVVATDNHRSRMLAQELALRYLRPLVSLGSHLEMDEACGSRRMLCRVTIPPVDGGWCLCCGDVVDATLAALEVAPTALCSIVSAAGYLPGIAAPAVYWLNSCCASLGVFVIHGVISGLLDIESGLDWVVDFGCRKWLEVAHDEQPDCLYCSVDGLLASGDSSGGFEMRPMESMPAMASISTQSTSPLLAGAGENANEARHIGAGFAKEEQER